MKKYNYEIETELVCFNCGSDKVIDLFQPTNEPMSKLNMCTGKTESIDSENYRIHFDCYYCPDCKSWDFPDPDLWQRVHLISGHKCKCQNTRFKIIYNDILSDEFEVRCVTCNEEYVLPKEPADS